jgi:hypothetical protein
MTDIAATLERVIAMQAEEIGRLRQINADLVADGREQAATIRTLVDQRGAGAEVEVEKWTALADKLHSYWCAPGVTWAGIAAAVGTDKQVIVCIVNGKVEPHGELRQRIEALISGEVSNG